MLQPGYTILEHPADLGIEARGATLPQAFQEAATALMSIIVDLSTVAAFETRAVALVAPDIEQLVVRWLNEILYLYDGQRFICKDSSVHSLSSMNLKATIRGEKFVSGKHLTKLDVKAITYHGLTVHEHREGAEIRVFLDI